MCTAIRLTTHDHYFGRNLDLEYSYQETVAITPRRSCPRIPCLSQRLSPPAGIPVLFPP